MQFFCHLVILIILNLVYTAGFLAAKVFTKVHHNHYLLGYGPGFVTFSIRKVTFTIGFYIPIIGLSRIYQIENSEKKQSSYAWEFTEASLAKRLFITYSGVLTLLLFAFITAAMNIYRSGERYIPKEEVNKHGVYPSAAAKAVGFETGDQIVAVNGKDYDNFYDLIHPALIKLPETYYTVLRGEQTLTITLRDADVSTLRPQEPFFELNAPFAVGNVLAGSPADKAEIKKGDKIVKVNDTPVVKYREMNHLLQTGKQEKVILLIERTEGKGIKRLKKRVQFVNDFTLGISIDEKIQYKTKDYSILQSLRIGIERVWSAIIAQAKALWGMVGLDVGGDERLTGPVPRFSANEDLFNVNRFLMMLSLFSGSIVCLNFFPFPKSALLEVIPLGYEAMIQKAFPYKAFRMIRRVAIAFLVLLILLQFVIDVSMLL